MSRGVLVFAQNNNENNYVLQACVLAMSLKLIDPDTKISLVTNDPVEEDYLDLFDKIIKIPWFDASYDKIWKIDNRWKLYHITPYRETIVLDADMIVLEKISMHWDFLSNFDLYFVNRVLTYRYETVTSDFYRKTFTDNNLPNLYSGFHYFKKSDFAHEFYTWLEIVMKNWGEFYDTHLPKSTPDHLSVDVACAIVTKIMNCESAITTNAVCSPTFVHMKTKLQNWNEFKQDWKDYVGIYVDDDCNLKIGNYQQTKIFHYTDKSFVNDEIVNKFRKKLNV
jgi:hypothetical protein